MGSAIRVLILRRIAREVGTNVFIGHRVTIVHPELLYLGSNISIHQDTYIDCSGTVKIGNDVSIAHGTSIVSFNHTYKGCDKIRNNKIDIAPIVIEGDVWIGCKAVILAGVILRHRTIVAAGCVVNQSYKGECILGGVPSRIIKEISQDETN